MVFLKSLLDLECYQSHYKINEGAVCDSYKLLEWITTKLVWLSMLSMKVELMISKYSTESTILGPHSLKLIPDINTWCTPVQVNLDDSSHIMITVTIEALEE